MWTGMRSASRTAVGLVDDLFFRIGVVFAALGVALLGGASGLRITKVEWPSGKEWLPGRPLVAQVEIRNDSFKEVLLWRGSDMCNQCARLVFRRPGLAEMRFANPGMAFSGLPAPFRLVPGSSTTYEVRVDSSKRPAPGTYQVTVEFENDAAENGFFQGIWTGRLSFNPVEIVVR